MFEASISRATVISVLYLCEGLAGWQVGADSWGIFPSLLSGGNPSRGCVGNLETLGDSMTEHVWSDLREAHLLYPLLLFLSRRIPLCPVPGGRVSQLGGGAWAAVSILTFPLWRTRVHACGCACVTTVGECDMCGRGSTCVDGGRGVGMGGVGRRGRGVEFTQRKGRAGRGGEVGEPGGVVGVGGDGRRGGLGSVFPQ